MTKITTVLRQTSLAAAATMFFVILTGCGRGGGGNGGTPPPTSTTTTTSVATDVYGIPLTAIDTVYERPGTSIRIDILYDYQNKNYSQRLSGGDFTAAEKQAIFTALDSVSASTLTLSGAISIRPFYSPTVPSGSVGIDADNKSIVVFFSDMNNTRPFDPTFAGTIVANILFMADRNSGNSSATLPSTVNQGGITFLSPGAGDRDSEGPATAPQVMPKAGTVYTGVSSPGTYRSMLDAVVHRGGNIRGLGQPLSDVHNVTIVAPKPRDK